MLSKIILYLPYQPIIKAKQRKTPELVKYFLYDNISNPKKTPKKKFYKKNTSP